MVAALLAGTALVPQVYGHGRPIAVGDVGDDEDTARYVEMMANELITSANPLLSNLPVGTRFFVWPRKKGVDTDDDGEDDDTFIETWDLYFLPPNSYDPFLASGTSFPGSEFNSSHALDILARDQHIAVVGASEIEDPNSPGDNGPLHAFYWTFDGATTVMTDLGTLAGDDVESIARAISLDGTTIVGSSEVSNGTTHAFRYNGGAMDDLGTFQGALGFSNARGVSDDGSVVVGDSTVSAGVTRAFRWVQDPGQPTGTMTDLGTLGLSSVATAVSGDGRFVVGGSALVVGTAFEQHAFLWSSETGVMRDLGTLPGHSQAIATAVSASGRIVVGFADPVRANAAELGYEFSDGSTTTHAFRWTESTGIVDLAAYLASNGVDMSGIRIATATAISPDGLYIAGNAHFDEIDADPASLRAYVLCFAGNETIGQCPEPGITTSDAVTQSLGDVQGSRAGVINHTGATAGMLLGSTDPMDGESSATALAAVGSLTLGIKGRYDLGNGLTLLGGLAYADFDVAGLSVGNALVAATGLRYVMPDQGTFRPFVEVGAWGTPQTTLTISRTYANGAGTATGTGTTTGSTGGLYAEGGVIFNPTAEDEIAVSGTIGLNWLAVAGYTESATGNPFPATFPAASDITTSVKATLAWTHEINEKIDFTLSASVGQLFGIDPVNATVAGLGTVTSPGGNQLFGEIGARVGYKVTEDLTLNGFVGGSFSGNSTHMQVGVGVSFRF